MGQGTELALNWARRSRSAPGFLLVIFAGATCLALSVIADPRGLVRFLPEDARDFLFNGTWDDGTMGRVG